MLVLCEDLLVPTVVSISMVVIVVGTSVINIKYCSCYVDYYGAEVM